jgi:predicted dehydrogenase
MEAFWSRFNPAVSEVIARARGGDIGKVRYLNADFAFPADVPSDSRLFDPNRGGGALLDIGVYPLFLAYSVLGVPDRITARMIPHATGVDLQMGMVLEYPSAMAMLYSGLASRSNMDATISGSEGRIVIHPTWHEADSYTLIPNDAAPGVRVHRPKTGRGFAHEIEECHRCIGAGLRESPLWSLDDSLALLEMADGVRASAELVYPSES